MRGIHFDPRILEIIDPIPSVPSGIRRDPRSTQKIIEGSKGIQDLVSNFTMGSNWTMYPILHLVERSGNIDPTLDPRPSPCLYLSELTRAPLGYFYNAPHWGGGAISSPPLISETTGPILKIQTAFERPGKTVEGKQILLTSGSRVTSQVRSKSKCSTFRAW